MKNSLKAFSILAASSLVAFIPAILAQSAPPPPPPPPAPAANGGNGAGPGASGGRRGAGAGAGAGAGFAANTDQPSATELAAINKALKALLSQDAAAKAALDAHPGYNPIQPQGGFNGAGRAGGPGASGSGGRRGGAGGSGGGRRGAGGSGAPAGSGTA